jgi:hypothetical protein
VIVIETNEKMHDARPCDGVDGLVLVREVGGDHLRSGGHRTCVASYEPERLIPRREEFDHFICYNAACTEDGDHVRSALAKKQRPSIVPIEQFGIRLKALGSGTLNLAPCIA